MGGSHFGKGQPRREFGDKHWNEPLLWDRDAAKANRKDRVFCASMTDVMDDEAPAGALDRLYATIDATPNLLWQFTLVQDSVFVAGAQLISKDIPILSR